jgi:DNA replication protein DnaC
MNKAPTIQEIEEKAKEHPVTIPERLELYRSEFTKYFNEETFNKMVETFNSFDEETKKNFYLDFLMSRSNMEFYLEQKKTDSFYNCSICKNTLSTHSIDFYNDGTGHYFHHESKPCKCNLIRKSLKIMQDNGLLGIIKKKTFSNFTTSEAFQKTIKTNAVNFVKAIIAKQKVSFFIGGQSGAGKTHICSAMLGELAKHGICVYFFNYINDIATLNRYQYNSTEKDEYENLLSLYKQADILYFDDFMFGEVSVSEQKIIFNIINHRYENDLPCIISSNKTMNDIRRINAPIYGRLYEMCSKFVININNDETKNFRTGGKNESI